jgi:predicted nucleic acid-binding protein
MAGVLPVKKPVYVVDTSYLVEFYKVGRHWKEINHQEVKKRFNEAIRNKCRLYVPVPVIFEIANHIAHVKDDNQRKQLVERFNKDIQDSFKFDSPFNLVPGKDFESVELLVNNIIQFAEQYAKLGLSLTDASVYLQAKQLKQDYKKLKNHAIHIWTLDGGLKRKEPDQEENPFDKPL